MKLKRDAKTNVVMSHLFEHSPLQAIYAAVERMNERSGAIVVPLE